jgi:NADPH2:quinone reductase
MGMPESDTPVDKTLLIINGAGGVGSFASQLARHVFGLKTVISTASRPETIEWCKSQGATHTINHRKPLKEQIDALGVTVDYALICYDPVQYLAELCEIVRPFGQIVSIVETKADIPLQGGFLKAISFHWEFMFARPMFDIDLLSQGLALDKIAQFVDSGKIKRLDTKVYDNLTLANLKAAHEILESGKAVGKIVLEVGKNSWQ